MRIATGVLPAVIALALAGCGGGDDETAETTAAETTKTTQLKFSDKGRIEQVGNEWAPLFAKDLAAACHYMYGQPLCEKYFGRVGEPPEVRSPSGFQKSFANATVERVEVKGARAGAKFSNGEPVEFVKETGSQAPRRFLGDWFVNVGGNAGKKYFEP